MSDRPVVDPRSDPNTPNGYFVLPTFGQDRDTWGNLTNNNWTSADTQLYDLWQLANYLQTQLSGLTSNLIAYVEPIGSLRLWPMPTAPAGWVNCNGMALSRATFPTLFALIGTTWGAGDGATTFNVPNLQGCVPVMFGGWMSFAQYAGEQVHILSVNEMPNHAHSGTTDVQGVHVHTYNGGPAAYRAAQGSAGDNGWAVTPAAGANTSSAGGHQHNVTTNPSGASWGHNNVQPSVGLSFIIKASYYGIGGA